MQDEAGRNMCDAMERPRSAALLAALWSVIALGAACHLDAVLHSPPVGGGRVGLDSLMQVKSDSVTPIPIGGSAPATSIVVRARIRDTTRASARLEIEIQAAGTPFQRQATNRSDPTPSGKTAYVPVTGLADNTSYHWQARLEGDTAWQPYGGDDLSAVDFRVALPPPANHLVFSQQPTSTGAGATMAAVKVTMVDAQGNTLTSFAGNVHVDISPNANPANGSLGGHKDVNAVAGVATFSDFVITKAGSGYRLEARGDGVAPVVSSSFGINPGVAHHPKYLVQPSNTTPNTAISPAVQVAIMDVYDNVATGFNATVFIGIANDGSVTKNAVLEPSGSQRAAAAGIATFEDLKIDQVGVGYTLVASATAVHAETSTPFNITP
jgi:hypothetical protein